MATFFTSDLHLGHARVIEYSHRPFRDVEAMDAAIVANWNAAVAPGDEVHVVGDFSFHRHERTLELLKSLRGRIGLVRGNHDKRLSRAALDRFDYVRDMHTVKIDDPDAPRDGVQRIVLCHYAMRVWDRSHYGAWHLYGHSHGSLPDDPNALSLDIGVDCWNYTPVSYLQVKERMKLKAWRPVDHHGARGEA